MSTNLIGKPSNTVPAKRMALLAWGLLIGLFTLSAWLFWRQNQNNSTTVPPDFQLAARVDLTARSYDGETVAQLRLEETAVVHIYYTLPNIDLTYFDLKLMGADGDTHLILHSEDYQTDKNGGGVWEERLSSGVYQLVLTAPQTTGTLSVYWTSK
jgi:hypothetical protein